MSKNTYIKAYIMARKSTYKALVTDLKVVLDNGLSLGFTNFDTSKSAKALTDVAVTWKAEDIMNMISFTVGNKNVTWNYDIATLREALRKAGSEQILVKIGDTAFKVNTGNINYGRSRNGLTSLNETDTLELNKILVEFFTSDIKLRRVTLFKTRQVSWKA